MMVRSSGYLDRGVGLTSELKEISLNQTFLDMSDVQN